MLARILATTRVYEVVGLSRHSLGGGISTSRMLPDSPDEEKGNEYSDEEGGAKCNFGLNPGCSEWVECVAKAYSRFEMLVGCLREILFSGTLVDEGIMAMEGERNECFS